MCVEIAIDKAKHRITSFLRGRVTVDTLRHYYRALYAHPDFDPTMSEIFDLSGVTEAVITGEELRHFSFVTAVNTCKGRGVRVAIVAPDDLTFGLARMYELLQVDSTNALRVVRTRAEADTWFAGGPGCPGNDSAGSRIGAASNG